MHETATESAWICPNDRHLALRAKLRSGWSVRTNQINTKNLLTEEELEKIRNVINKATMLEKMEQERIGCLVHRLNMMRQNSMGDGIAACILCAEQFGKFVGSTPIICIDCKRKVCNKCCVDYGTGLRPSNVKQQSPKNVANLLCKICSENRQLWKRSGAWFFQALPVYTLPSMEPPLDRKPHRHPYVTDIVDSPKLSGKNVLAIPDSPAMSARGHNRSLSGSSTGSFQWAKPTKYRLTSSSESEVSSDDDGITLGKVSKQTPMQLRSSDATSLASSTSVTSTGNTSNAPSQSPVSRRSSGRRTFRGRPNFPKVTVTDEWDTTSIDSRETDFSTEGGGMLKEMSTLHGESTEGSSSLQSQNIVYDANDKENRGTLEFTMLYDPPKCALHVNIIKAKNLISMDSNGFSDPYVKLHLLPGATKDDRNEATKLRTKTKNKTLNPIFDETLTYWGILEKELPIRQLRLTVLDEDRFSNDFLGEVIVPLDRISATQEKRFDLPLKAPYALKEEEKVPGDPGRIYVGLCYHTQEHYLSVKVHRCTSLVIKKSNNSTVNAFVRVTVFLDDKKISQKTDVKKKTTNPVFDRELKFKVSPENGQAELARGSLEISVVHKDHLGQEVIGFLRLGIDSTGEKLKHWFSYLKHKDQQFDNWHILSSEPNKKTKGK